MPKISVIVPVYRVEQYLNECVDSILTQSFDDFELILIDDGSPDNCGKICDEYASRDERVKVIHQKNGGLSAARNAGIDIAKGKYFTFIDSDDLVSEVYLETLYRGIVDYDCDISLCGEVTFTAGNPKYMLSNENIRIVSGRDAAIELYKSSRDVSITTWGKLYKNALFKEIRFPVGKIHEDNYTTPILLYEADKVFINLSKLYGYRQHSDSIMGASFSVKRFDGVQATDYCIKYFESKEDKVLAELATTHRMLLLFLMLNDAKKAGVYSQIPNEYKISEIRLVCYLQKALTNAQFTYQLSKVHPNWILPYEYLRKLKKILGLRVRD